MQLKYLALAGIAAGLFCEAASADLLFSNRGVGIDGPDVFSSAINAPLLEDGMFTGSGPFSLTAINVGYDNTGTSPINADVLITFFDNVDYNASPGNPINTGQVGPTYRFSFVAAPGADETGFFSIPGLIFPDSSFGVIVNFVAPNTDTPLLGINHLFRDIPLNAGLSDDLFGFDFDLNGTIDSSEVFTWDDATFPPGNLFIEIQGVAVPEPAALSALAAGVALLVRRRVTR